MYDASKHKPSEAVAITTEKTTTDPKELVRAVVKRSGEVKRRAAGGSYCVLPEKRFVNEQQDEEVALLLRAHPITNIGWMMLVVIMLIVPEIFVSIGMFAGVPGKLVFIGRLAWYLVTLGFAFEKFLYWFYSVVVITNERIIDIDFINLLQRDVSYVALNHVEEPSMVAGGLFRTIFQYGDVNVASAAEVPSVEAKAVPYPDRVVRIISELSEELEKRRERGE